MTPSTLAVIPARGGSKGLPGKNIRLLAGLPLIEHSLRLAALCPEIDRTIVSTDSEAIAEVSRAVGGDVPFLRPAELARDDTPMLSVLAHALESVDPGGVTYDLVLLLDPTSPGRLPGDVTRACGLLRGDVDGVVAVSEPAFNPIWLSVVEEEGILRPLLPEAASYTRRQDVPRVLRINAALYLFRSDFVRSRPDSWMTGRHAPLEIPDIRAFHIDGEEDFRVCELLLETHLVEVPWLE